ncbi:MAG: TcmI family type II polyketide cyclase [Pseudonocardiaceae bacterium]
MARMEPDSSGEVARIFDRFDRTEMPNIMGTRRRQLFLYRGLYFHFQDFGSDGGEAIERVRSHPLFVDVCAALKPHVTPYDPETWRSPADAMATRFYDWNSSAWQTADD